MAWVAIYQQVRDHPKLRDFYRKLAISRQEALGLLVFIWLWGLDNTDRNGQILSATIDDIADAAYWKKDPKELYSALVECRWIDDLDGVMYIHDWDEFNKPYFDYIDKKEKDKLRKRSEKNSRDSDGNSVENPLEIRQEFHVSQNKTKQNLTIQDNNKESSKDDLSTEVDEHCPHQGIMNLFNSVCVSLPKVNRMTKSRQDTLRVWWRKEKLDMDILRSFFEQVESSDFLTHRRGSFENCSFDWIIKPANRQKIVEGNYDNKNKEDWRSF